MRETNSAFQKLEPEDGTTAKERLAVLDELRRWAAISKEENLSRMRPVSDPPEGVRAG